jgi:hypothetical protein
MVSASSEGSGNSASLPHLKAIITSKKGKQEEYSLSPDLDPLIGTPKGPFSLLALPPVPDASGEARAMAEVEIDRRPARTARVAAEELLTTVVGRASRGAREANIV